MMEPPTEAEMRAAGKARGFRGLWRTVVVRPSADVRHSRERLEAFFARRRAAWAAHKPGNPDEETT